MELQQLSKVSSWNGIRKSTIYFGALILFSTLLFSSEYLALTITLQMLIGLFLAHGLELQHEALHNILFRNKYANYLVGFFFGIFHGVSYTQYQRQHLFHHRYLGTDEDEEIFDYDADSLNSVFSFTLRALNVARIPSLFINLFKFLGNRFPKAVIKTEDKLKIIFEYLVIISMLVFTVAYTVYTSDFILVKMWLIPWLIFGEIFHFLIELPEHLFCRKDLNDIFSNTRTIYTKNRFLLWLVNGNNYHVEHHLYPQVTIENLKNVNSEIKDKIKYSEVNYRTMYKKVFEVVFLKKNSWEREPVEV